jgi:shikimate kinase
VVAPCLHAPFMKRGSAQRRNVEGSPPRLVLLVGFMGSGKSSVGEALAEKLGWAFVDLDHQIERVSGQTIPELFRKAGEREFRRLERSLLRQLLEESGGDRLIALGGGTFAQRGVPEMARRAGAISVFLDASVEELWARCCGDGRERPLAMDQNQFRQLYAARRKRYMKADLRVHTSGKSVRHIAEEVCSYLEQTPVGEN